MNRHRCALRLLHRRLFFEELGEQLAGVLFVQFRDSELVFFAKWLVTVDHYTEDFEAAGDGLAKFINGTDAALGGHDREQARLGDNQDAVRGYPSGLG